MRTTVPSVTVFSLALAASCSSSAAPESAEVLVPAGDAIVGANCVAGNVELGCLDSPRNRREVVHLDAFYVDRILATRDDYRHCIQAGACATTDEESLSQEQEARRRQTQLGRYRLTKASVSQQGAAAYCRWRGARLLTSDEFERIARGTDGRVTPWEGGWGPCTSSATPSYACTIATGPAGARAIAYNPQWVAERNDRYPAGMIRGKNADTFAAGNERGYWQGWTPTLHAGFRCARSADHSPATGSDPAGSSPDVSPPAIGR